MYQGLSPSLAGRDFLRVRGLAPRDYFAREESAAANAVPTALAMGHCKNYRKDRLTFPGGLGKLITETFGGDVYADRYRDQREGAG